MRCANTHANRYRRPSQLNRRSVLVPHCSVLVEARPKVADIAYEKLIATRFSRTDESEADRIGLELAARAGYDPRAGVTVVAENDERESGRQPARVPELTPRGKHTYSADTIAAADCNAVI
jgi:predicted Zn-dependent protease